MNIKYPIYKSEFETHAELFLKLKKLDLNVRGEVTDKSIRNMSHNKKGMKECRFDLVLFDKNNVSIAIIEVKSNGRKEVKGRQKYKYGMYGIPVIFCMGDKDIDKTVNIALSLA